MAILFANNAFGTLATSINTTVTSISLQSGQGARFPSPAGGDIFYATLVNQANELEIVKCTGRVNDTLTVQRAQEGTPARSFVAGDRIELRLTAAGLTDFVQGDRQVATGPGLTGGGDLSQDLVLAVDSTVVRTTGPQTISGTKTFTEGVVTTGENITNLVADRLTSGLVPAPRLPLAAPTDNGAVRARLSGDTLFLRTDGNNA